MCLTNPVLARALIAARVAKLQRSAQVSGSIRPHDPQSRVTATARRRAGWLLVDLGLRLAVPRS